MPIRYGIDPSINSVNVNLVRHRSRIWSFQKRDLVRPSKYPKRAVFWGLRYKLWDKIL